jgi:hypothetical protein
MNHNPPLIPRVSPYAVWYKLREREAIRYLHSVFVLRGNRDTSRQNGDRYRNTETDQRAFFHCRISLVGSAANVDKPFVGNCVVVLSFSEA